jgi:hypothetical protein
MLEESELLLGPPGADDGRAIAAASGAPVGSARWRPPGRPAWWRLGRRVLEVREHGDEPLVFTVRRRWGLLSRYEVRDADGHFVGYVLGAWLQDAAGTPLAVCRPDAGGVVAPGGDLLAAVSDGGGATRVTFAPAVAGDPFAKMVLLAAALLRW